MTTISHPALPVTPRAALALDAAVTAAVGAAYVVAAGPLEDLLGLDTTLLVAVGAFQLVYAAALALLARRQRIARGALTAVVEGNALWAVGSVVVAAAQWGSPTTAGTVWIVLQALTVAGFAALQLASRNR